MGNALTIVNAIALMIAWYFIGYTTATNDARDKAKEPDRIYQIAPPEFDDDADDFEHRLTSR